MADIFSSDSESDSEEKTEIVAVQKRSTMHQYVMPKKYDLTESLKTAINQKDIQQIKDYVKSARNIKSKEFEGALWNAAAIGFAAGVQILFQAGVNTDFFHGSSEALTPLMVAAQQGHTACVKVLLGNRRGPLTDRNLAKSPHNGNKKTALFYAVSRNHIDCVKVLVENYAKVTTHTFAIAIAYKGLEYCQELFKSQTTTFDSNFCYKAVIPLSYLTLPNRTKIQTIPDEDVMHFLVENVKFTKIDQTHLFRYFAGLKYNRWKYLLENQWKPDSIDELFGTRFTIANKYKTQVLQNTLRLVMKNDPESEIHVNAESFCLLFDQTFVRINYDINLLQTFIKKYELDKLDEFTFRSNILDTSYNDMRLENVKFLMNYNINPINVENEVIVHVSTTQELKRALYVSRAFSVLFFIILKVDELEWPTVLQKLTNVTIIGNNTTFTSKVVIKCQTICIKGCNFPHGLECNFNRLFMEECKVNNFSCITSEFMSVCKSQIVENGLTINSDDHAAIVELVNTTFERCSLGIACLSNFIDIYTSGVTFKENTYDVDMEYGTFFIENPSGLKVDSNKLESYKPNDGQLVVIRDRAGYAYGDNGWYRTLHLHPGACSPSVCSDKGVRSNKVFRLLHFGNPEFTHTFQSLVLEGYEFVEILQEPPTRMYPFISELVFKLNLLVTEWDFTRVIETTGIFYSLLSCFNDCENILSPTEFDVVKDQLILSDGYCIMDKLVRNIIESKYYDDLVQHLFDLGATVSKYTIAYAIENIDITPNILELCIENGSIVSEVEISNALYLEVGKKNLKVLVDSTSADASEMIKALIHNKYEYPDIFKKFLKKIKEQIWEDTGVIGYVITRRDTIEEDFQYEEYIPELIAAGADINAVFNERDEKPRTPLYLCATEWGNIEAFQQILEIADTSGQIEDILRYVGNHHIHNQTNPEKLLCAGLLMDIVEEIPFQRYLENPMPVDSEDFFRWLLTVRHNVIDILFRRCRFDLNGTVQTVKEPHLNPNLIPLCNMVDSLQLANAGASPWWPKRFSQEETDTQRKKEWQDQVKHSEKLAMEVLHWHGAALQYLPYKMQNAPQLCLEAVKQDGMALHWCSINRKMDVEVVTEAVTQNWRAFEFLPEHLEHAGHVLPLPAQDYGPWIIWMKDNLFGEGAVHEGQWTQFMTTFPMAAGLAMYRNYDSQERKKASVNEALKSFKRKRVDDLYKHRIVKI
jgi:ankyrin repeat protein